MKVLFLAPSLSRKMGGIFEISRSLAFNLSSLGVSVEALGLEDEGWKDDQILWDGISCQTFPVRGPHSFGYSKELRDAVLESNAQFLHLHALWLYTSILTLSWKKIKHRPYMVTPNGMLEPWALRNSAWKKHTARMLYENKMLCGASCLQANTKKEFNDLRSFGLKNPIAIIPNGVDLPTNCPIHEIAIKNNDKVRTLLFLGRIHAKKGLFYAIRAWSMIEKERKKSWQFIIAGWDQGGHQLELIKICQELGIPFLVEGQKEDPSGAEIIFTGAAFGDKKDYLLRHADAFILPSLSEGLPISVLEAWAYELPVLMTQECNLTEGFHLGAAIPMEPNIRSVTDGLSELFLMSSSDLHLMGKLGNALVRKSFTWASVAKQMAEVYAWILGGGSPPECVINNSKNTVYVTAS